MNAYKFCFKWFPFANQIFKMYTLMKKIQKDKDVEPTEFEQSVAQVPSFFQTCFSCPVSTIANWFMFLLTCVYFIIAGIVWLGEHTPRAQEWLEGLVHQLCKVMIAKLQAYTIILFVLHYANPALFGLGTVKLISLETKRRLWSMFLTDWGNRSARSIPSLLGSLRRSSVERYLVMILMLYYVWFWKMKISWN